jgi:nitrate/TMAO reductase-like tetraheme cytochrome c subunit
MKALLNSLQRFFFPPAGSPRWVKILPYFVLGVLTLMLLTGGVYAWDYTNSSQFCGATCHTMPPEYTAYLTSPHARIDCVDCHIGKGFIATRITRKAGDLKHIFATAFKTYEYPIRAGELRPARETCEKCHFPEKFSDDSLREIIRYTNDKDNTPKSIYLIFKTGGGSKRLRLGKGIHWHIVNKVYYLPLDQEEQQIPYVKVIEDNGTITEYVDIGANFDPQTVNPKNLKEMDCITCHNRVTHLVPQPEDTIDELISRGLISRDIPEIHRKSLEVYSQLFKTTQEGLNNIAGLSGYYQAYYPEFYTLNKDKIDTAISTLQAAYKGSVYAEQRSDWTAHPNNIGHANSPGCFRCHDGKHMNKEQKAIRLECNLCHSIPVVAGPTNFVADLEISRGPEPQSHLNPNWISMHRDAFNPICEKCHITSNPGGTDNSSFCSNSACHGNVWKYAGFDAPALRAILISQLPPAPTPAPLPTGGPLTYIDTIGPLFKARCGTCHGASGILGLDLLTYQTAMAGSSDGPVIIPGNPQGSILVQKQSTPQGHFGQLTPDELKLVSDWIAAGAPEK